MKPFLMITFSASLYCLALTVWRSVMLTVMCSHRLKAHSEPRRIRDVLNYSEDYTQVVSGQIYAETYMV